MDFPIRSKNATWDDHFNNHDTPEHQRRTMKQTRKLSSPSLRSLLSPGSQSKRKSVLTGKLGGSMRNLGGMSSKSHHQGIDKLMSPRSSASKSGMPRRRSSVGLNLTERSRRKAEQKQQKELAYLVMAEFADCEV